MKGAHTTELDPDTPYPGSTFCPNSGGQGHGRIDEARLPEGPVKPGSKAAALYGATEIGERHRHRYEVNPDFIERLESAGWKFTGRSEDGVKMEIGELEGHPYFVACQFHPEFKSRPKKPSPLHLGLIKAALEYKQAREDRRVL
jgi:CTP synthase